MNDLSVWLDNIGLTIGQAVGFGITIFTTLLAASATRSSSKESRRQHNESKKIEKLEAAGALIIGLNEFEQQLEERLYDNINCSQLFDHHVSLKGIGLPKNAHSLASKLNETILADIITLGAKRARAIRAVESTLIVLDEEDAENEVIRHAARLILDTVSLIHKINIEVGTNNLIQPSMEMDRLKAFANGVDESIVAATR